MGKSPYDVVVLGAGVLGLSTAAALTEAGVRVAIIARDLPEDVTSAAFASPWAGANWSSFAVNEDERRRDTHTFHAFADIAKAHPNLVQRIPFRYIWNEDAGYSAPWYKDLVFDFRILTRSELPAGFSHGVGFTSYCLNPPDYIAHLASSLRAKGVPIIRHRLGSLDEAYSVLGDVSLVVNATGLGARTLLGVQDLAVFPARGQTVLVRAPNVKTCYGLRDKNLPVGQSAYIIPRPGPDGHVVLGGTFLPNDYSTLPDPATAERILKSAYAMCPALAGERAGGGRGGSKEGWQDIQIVAHNVGLRPAREGGLRLEIEERSLGQEPAPPLTPARGKTAGPPRDVAVVHCYGIGPAGYQASLGIAKEAAELALGYLSKSKAKL